MKTRPLVAPDPLGLWPWRGAGRGWADRRPAGSAQAFAAAAVLTALSIATTPAMQAEPAGGTSSTAAAASARAVVPFPAGPYETVPEVEMQRVYDTVKTPFKYGVVLRPDAPDESFDCPSVFRFGDRWYMLYVAIKGKVGYQTHLATSADLLRWTPLGKVLPFSEAGWDRWQADGGAALVDTTWGGSGALLPYDGRYWMSFIGGAQQGYETEPLSIGLAWTKTPDQAVPWHRLAENPVLSPDQPDARPFERATLFKSQIIWDHSSTLGYPFVMFYNAKQEGQWVERIGMAVSKDMVHWLRFGAGPVIENTRPKGGAISGDPQIVRIGGLWVMFYFGAGWRPHAFDTFACSYDLMHWTKWTGPDLMAPSEPWDKTFAHKPWVLKHDDIVYHFYCAVGDEGRVIALATSKDLRRGRGQP